MLTNPKEGDLVILDERWRDKTCPVKDSPVLLQLGDSSSPLFVGTLEINQVDSDNTVELSNYRWYSIEWLNPYNQEKANDEISNRELLIILLDEVREIKELLGVCEHE